MKASRLHILILGGTRFVGKLLAERLLGAGCHVMVSSRRPENAPSGAEVHAGERALALEVLGGRQFDYVIDFTCYGESDAKSVVGAFPDARVILISTIWVTRLARGMGADMPFPDTPFMLDGIPELSATYLTNKVAAERVFYEAFTRGLNVGIIRLPIIWGEGDHTNRMDFYRSRIIDGHPLILVDGAVNLAQISWSIDVAQGIAQIIIDNCIQLPLIIEAASNAGLSVMHILDDIAQVMGVNWQGIPIVWEEVSVRLPDYLDAEPLWREFGRDVTPNNLFGLLGMRPTPMREWLKSLPLPVSIRSKSRAQEIGFIHERDVAGAFSENVSRKPENTRINPE